MLIQRSREDTILPASGNFRALSPVAIDGALIFSALFFQRFSLFFGNSLISLDAVAVAVILIYQFARGRVLINYDRLLWFFAVAFTVSYSLS